MKNKISAKLTLCLASLTKLYQICPCVWTSSRTSKGGGGGGHLLEGSGVFSSVGYGVGVYAWFEFFSPVMGQLVQCLERGI